MRHWEPIDEQSWQEGITAAEESGSMDIAATLRLFAEVHRLAAASREPLGAEDVTERVKRSWRYHTLPYDDEGMALATLCFDKALEYLRDHRFINGMRLVHGLIPLSDHAWVVHCHPAG